MAPAAKNGKARPKAKAAKGKKNAGPKEMPTRKTAAPKAAKPPKAKGPGMGAAMFSGMNPTPIPAYQVCGQAFHLRGVVRKVYTIPVNNAVIIAATNLGSWGSVMSMTTFDPVSATGAVNQVYTIPVLSAADDAGGPTSTRAMKCSVVLTCVTPILDRGGQIYRLHAQQRVRLPAGHTPSGVSGVNWELFSQSLQSHPDVRPGDLADYGKPRELVCNVVDQTRYHDFDEFQGTGNADNFWTGFSVWTGSTPTDRPMSTCFYVIYAGAKAQTISFAAYAHFYTRWALDTVPGQAMKPIPTASTESLNALHKAAVVSAHATGTVTIE